VTKIVWDAVGTRRYEVGVDRGVLYTNDTGVPWSGLVAVKESHAGGESRAYYVDGVRYANRITFEEFEATIDAYTYPEEFSACDGSKSLSNGLFVRQQRRKPFGFSYRTLVGDDVLGLDRGYKIHLVYNALAEPVDREHSTLSDNISPFLFSWKIVTKPPILNFVPTAHFIIDSRSTPDGLLSSIENILYGTPELPPRLPLADELVYLFTSYSVVDYDAGDPDDISYYTFDGGGPVQGSVTTILDGGTP
jgi:hypothetical protein